MPLRELACGATRDGRLSGRAAHRASAHSSVRLFRRARPVFRWLAGCHSYGMNLAALWHDLECGGYREDLPLWRSLADEQGGPVLDIGAGTGRVALDLAARGVPVVALDADAALLEALDR